MRGGFGLSSHDPEMRAEGTLNNQVLLDAFHRASYFLLVESHSVTTVSDWSAAALSRVLKYSLGANDPALLTHLRQHFELRQSRDKIEQLNAVFLYMVVFII